MKPRESELHRIKRLQKCRRNDAPPAYQDKETYHEIAFCDQWDFIDENIEVGRAA